MPDTKRFVIVGGDAAGMSAASKLRKLDPDWDIVVFEAGKHVSYAACGIPYYIGGAVEKFGRLLQVSVKEFEEDRRIKVRLGHRVTSVDRGRRIVKVMDGSAGAEKEEPYDKLLIATGARPAVPPIQGIRSAGVFFIRDMESARVLRQFIDERRGLLRSAVVIGGGYVGLEMVEAFAAGKLEVTLVEAAPSFPPGIEGELYTLVSSELMSKSIRVITRQAVAEIRDAGGRKNVILGGGGVLKADLVLVAAGVVPNAELAASSGLATGVKGAVSIDRHGLTSDPDIYAAGDCAEVYHRVLGGNTWIPLALSANRLGRVVGENVAGMASVFPGVVGTAVVKIIDLTYARTGLDVDSAEKARMGVLKETVIHTSRAGYYPGASPLTVTVIFEEKGGRIVGAQMAGRDVVAKRIDVFATAISAGMTVMDVADLDLAYAPPFGPVYDPVILSCQVAMRKLQA